mgnify:FL=1
MKVNKLTLIIFLLTVVINNSHLFAQEIIKDTLLKIENTDVTILEDEIIKNAQDSIKIDIINRKIFLYGKAEIKYSDIKISAGYIEIDWNTNTIIAKPKIDSSGRFIEKPVFEENNETFKSKEIRYNFKTKKGLIKELNSKEGEGYILGEKVKKTDNDIFYLQKGDYTTCDAEHPHFSIRANKIKLIPGEKIITGPAYLRIFNFPTPLFLPFGYFPNKKENSSGLIIPSYGESANLGFFLKEGGYYFTISDKIDLSLKGDIYSKGSWGLKSLMRYKKRYKFSGNLNLSYGNIVNSEKGFTDYSLKKDFFVRWSHKQDPKSTPSLLFSANVNAGSSTYHRNNSFNSNEFLSNTFQSSVNLSKRWSGTPFSLSANLRHNQNTQTKIINLSLPDISFNMNRVFPFKKIGIKGKNNWYHKIGVSYSSNIRNDISVADSLLFTNQSLKSFRNGIKHSIPISTSIKILKYFTFSPKINFTERWYSNQIQKNWNVQDSLITTDTISKFTRAGEYNISTSINTKIYGLLQFNKGKIKAIRHVITPNLSFSYRPDFSNRKYRYFEDVQSSSNGDIQEYSIMQNGIFGSPSKGRNGNIIFNISNILEAKINSKKDTVNNIKKIKILENLNIGSSYNLFADSLQLNDINLNARTRLLDIIDLKFSSRYDPYIANDNRTNNLNKFELLSNGRLVRLMNANATIGLVISNKLFSKNENKKPKTLWNLNANYSIIYNKGYKDAEFADTIQSLNFSGDLKISDKWKLSFQSGYDFDAKKLTYTSINIYRDLHCWEMMLNLIPIGYHKSYTFTIRVKASALQDLKLERKRDWIDTDFN